MKKTMKVEVVGFDLGKASGWDDMGEWALFFYDFVPNNKIKHHFPDDWNGGIYISTTNGDVEFYQDGIDDPIKKIKFKDLIGV